MTPRRIIRWKSFWFGVLVVGFLGWAWLDSTRCETSVRYGQKSFSHAGSGIFLADLGHAMSLSPIWNRGPLSSSDVLWTEVRFDGPEALRLSGDPTQVYHYCVGAKDGDITGPRSAAAVHFSKTPFFPQVGAWAIYIPHWLMLTCFLVPWSAFLAWRWRRQRRILTKALHDAAAAP